MRNTNQVIIRTQCKEEEHNELTNKATTKRLQYVFRLEHCGIHSEDFNPPIACNAQFRAKLLAYCQNKHLIIELRTGNEEHTFKNFLLRYFLYR